MARFGPDFHEPVDVDPVPEGATEAEAVEAAIDLAETYVAKGDSASLAAQVAALRYDIAHRFDDVFDAVRDGGGEA